MKTKRTHKNTTRLTALERAVVVCADIYELPDVTFPAHCKPIHRIIERALQAHAREAMDRATRRRDAWYATGKGRP